MANEEWTKRILRLAGYSPKDTREPRGPDHMAKMKAARGPYSDPRDTYIMSEIRRAFESSNGRPLSTGYVVEKVFGWQLRLNGKPKKSHHYQSIRRALRKVATPIGRTSSRGRSHARLVANAFSSGSAPQAPFVVLALEAENGLTASLMWV